MGAFAYLFLPNLPRTVTETKENTHLIYHYCNISDCLIGYKRSTKEQDKKDLLSCEFCANEGGGGELSASILFGGGGLRR